MKKIEVSPVAGKEIQRLMDEFGRAIEKLAENVKQCAKIYTKAVMLDITARDEFPLKFPFLPGDMWRCLEKVGRGMMDERCLFHRPRVFRILHRLPLAEQTKILNEGLMYLTDKGDSLLVRLEDIQSEESRQIFAGDHIRDLGEQRLYCERLRKRHFPGRPMDAFEVKNGFLVVYQECRFTLEDLRKILAEMRRLK